MENHLIAPNKVSLRYERPHVSELPEINTIAQAMLQLRRVIEPGVLDLKEYCWILLLTADNKLLGISEVNSGTVVGIKFFAREIMQLALLSNAVCIILVHNHPSGSLEASAKDIEATKEIVKIGKLMDIHLQDHIIITSENFVSLKSFMKWEF